MGKTKTAFVEETRAPEKSSEVLYREKKEKQNCEKAEKAEKIHIAGLKGGQRVKIVEAEIPEETEQKTEGPERAERVEGKKKEVAPRVRSKKYQEARKKFDGVKTYPISEAIKHAKESSFSKFDGTMELHLVVKKIGLSANLALPFAAGKAKKVEIADDETIKKLSAGKIDFDILLATAEMMPKLVPFAKVLGPRGLMPNPKNGTLIKKASDAEKFKGNTVSIKTEKEAPLIHTVIGKVSQKDEELVKNAEAIFKALGAGKAIVKAFTKATMGPSVKVSIT